MFRRTLEKLSISRGLSRWFAHGEPGPASHTAPLAIENLEERRLLTGFGANDFIVAGYNNGTLADLDQNGNFQGTIDSLPGAVGLDFLANGNLVAAGQGSGVKEYDSAGNVVTSFNNNDIGDPIDLKASSSNLLYAGNQQPGGAPEVNLSGTTLRFVGTNNYDSIALLPNNVVWAGGDGYQGKIDVIDLTSGNVTSTITLDHGQNDAESMFYSASTNTVLTTSDNQGVFERDLNGNFIREFAFPTSTDSYGVTRGPGGDVFATDFSHSSILEWHADGTFVGSIDISSNVSGPTGLVWAGNSNPNFVVQNGTLTVHGTTNADNFTIQFSDSTDFTVTLGSESHAYTTGAIQQVVFNGATAQASAVVDVSHSFRTFKAMGQAGSLQATTSGFEVDINAAPTIDTYGNPASTAFLQDTASGSFVGSATGQYGYITGTGFFTQAVTFGNIYATTSGTSNTATLYIPDGIFIDTPNFGEIYSPTVITASGFHHLSANGGGSGQGALAMLYLGANSTLTGTSTYSSVDGPTGQQLAIGFDSLTAYADASHTDKALIYSVSGATMLLNPTYSELKGNHLSIVGVGFPTLYAIASSTGGDSVSVFAGAGQSVVSTPAYVSLTGGGMTAQAQGFSQASVYGNHGAGNNIWLYDSPGDDHLTVQGNMATLVTPTTTTTVTNFDAVDAVHSAGNDVATLSVVDYSLQLTGQWGFQLGVHLPT
jgi:hypothetical protein